MSEETALVMTARMDPPLVKLVTDACAHARVHASLWDGPAAAVGDTEPSLVIAALPMGERTIPPDVADRITKTFRALPLLLLCAEPLIRNCITLQNGRVTLLGLPLTLEKISGRIRTALVGHAESGFSPMVGDGRTTSTVRVQEFRGRDWWVSAIARQSDRAGVFPAVRKLGPHGFAGLLPIDLSQPLASEVLDRAADALVTALPSDQALAAVKERVGTGAAGIWFAPSSQRWTLYCPQPDLDFWLISPSRLPGRWRMPGSGGGNGAAWRQLPAASGDMILICVGAAALLEADIKGGALWKVADGGGPAVLDHLESRFSQTPDACAALIVELR